MSRSILLEILVRADDGETVRYATFEPIGADGIRAAMLRAFELAREQVELDEARS